MDEYLHNFNLKKLFHTDHETEIELRENQIEMNEDKDKIFENKIVENGIYLQK